MDKVESPQPGHHVPLTLRAERVDPKHLTAGRPPAVEAELTANLDTHGIPRRHYQLTKGVEAAVQLNHGDPADDPTRLRGIAEDLLGPPGPEPIREIGVIGGL